MSECNVLQESAPFIFGERNSFCERKQMFYERMQPFFLRECNSFFEKTEVLRANAIYFLRLIVCPHMSLSGISRLIYRLIRN